MYVSEIVSRGGNLATLITLSFKGLNGFEILSIFDKSMGTWMSVFLMSLALVMDDGKCTREDCVIFSGGTLMSRGGTF